MRKVIKYLIRKYSNGDKMKINSQDLKNKVLSHFKKCSPPLIFDRMFAIVSRNELQNIVRINSVSYVDYISELFDCNRFSLALRSNISLWQREKYKNTKDSNYRFPIAFGSCLIENKDGFHSLCIALCQDGFCFIEPQSDKIFDIEDPKKILFIEF